MPKHHEESQEGPGPHRQWGAEASTEPLPIIHSRPSAFKLVMSRVGILVTVVSWAMYMVTTVIGRWVNGEMTSTRLVVETVIYLSVVTFLSFSALMYLISRQGAFTRFREHQRVPRAVMDAHFSKEYPHGITVLIPSYVEELRVVEKTMWSAALQEFPSVNVVLLIDDPPLPRDPDRMRTLAATREIATAMMDELAEPSDRVATMYAKARESLAAKAEASAADIGQLSLAYRWSALWLEQKGDAWGIEDHTDQFFVDQVLNALANDLRSVAWALDESVNRREAVSTARAEQLYRRLIWIFGARVTSFERKLYASLSHEANKAMNLNAYIALMGHRWKRIETAQGIRLRAVEEGEFADFEIPDSEYLLTLDADSMLLRDYCIRLVYLLEQKAYEHVAVIQTPYCSYRGAPTRLERIAAATTDVQHILHQGLTQYDSTFWVGANAVIRKRALDDIAQVSIEGANTVTTYIQDRTVIEDTESSIDLGVNGWHLVNYPERLSYSATPPDFGSLVVQRRRWANGGLLILPKFMRQKKARKGTRLAVRAMETALRVNYMASIAWSSIGLVFLLAYPFDSRLLSPWVIAAAFPYFFAMSQDLSYNRYKWTDIFRIYGFNLILLAVNLAGTVKSIEQGITNEKIPFARTPKVSNRTATPWLFASAPYMIIGFSLFILVLDVNAKNWGNAIFAGFNAVMCAWALLSYIGIWPSIQDTVLGLWSLLYVPIKKAPESSTSSAAHSDGWKDVLYYGDPSVGGYPTGTAIVSGQAMENSEVSNSGVTVRYG